MLKRLTIIALMIIVTISTIRVYAATTPTVTTIVDKQFGTVNDYFKLTIAVKNANSVVEPVLMDKQNFAIVSQSRSSKFIILNGKQERTTTFTYILKPLQAGTLNIGESYVTANGQRLYTKPLQITIDNAGGYYSQNRRSPGNTTSKYSQNLQNLKNRIKQNYSTNSSTKKQSYQRNRKRPTPNHIIQQNSRVFNQLQNADNLIFEGYIDKNKPYVNEQVTYTLKILYRGYLRDLNLELPTFKDFIVEPLDQDKQYSTRENGVIYSVFEQSYALFPTDSGVTQIPSAKMTGQFFPTANNYGFIGSYGYRTVDEVSTPIKIEVQALPPAPKEFENAVGQYTIDTNIENTKIKTGETTELKITINGKGNILNIKDPDFKFNKHFKDSFKIYPKKPITQLNSKNDVITGQKIFNFDLVATKTGKFNLPIAEYAYFNPETKTYYQLRSKPTEITVEPGATQEDLDLAGGKDSLINDSQKVLDDIININTNNSVIENKSLSKKNILIYSLLFFIPPIGLLLIFSINKYQETIENNKEFIKKHLAYNEAKTRLNKLKPLVKQNNYKDFYYHLDNILKDYIGSKLYLPSKTLTAKDVEFQLKAKNINSKTILFTVEILNLCEKSEFASGSDLSKKVIMAFKDSQKLLKTLERELK